MKQLATGLMAMIGLAAATTGAAAQNFNAQAGPLIVEQVAKGLQNPWALGFLPDGRMLVTERPGRLRIVSTDGRLSRPVSGVPAVVARNQGGLLDVVPDPAFAQNRLIYFCFAEARSGGNATAVARAELDVANESLGKVEVIFRQQPVYNGGYHFGCRVVPDGKGALFVTLGDRYDLRDEAQNGANTIGKVVRIAATGGAAPGNPGKAAAGSVSTAATWAPEIWSIGHRNIQGAALHPETGQLWTAEHGARGGDEINTPKPGRNYGWPVITYGVDYSGARIGDGTAKAGLEQPVFFWDPSIAPSGATFYTGSAFPAWRGNLFVGALAGQRLSRLEIAGEKVVREEQLLMGLNKRIRDVRQGPDGFLYLAIDAPEGEILRLRPAR